MLRAASAEAALALAPQQTLSLITLDLQLPGIDGWEFLAANARRQRRWPSVPVVIISGLADSQPGAEPAAPPPCCKSRSAAPS